MRSGRAGGRLLLWAFLGCLFPALAVPQTEWTPEAQVNWDDVYNDWMPMIAAGSDGRIWVVWHAMGPHGWEVMSSVWDSGSWSYPLAVCEHDGVQEIQADIAVGSDNVPWVVLVRSNGDPPYLHYARWNGVAWDPAQPMFPDLADERFPLAPRIAVDSEGTPWVIWSSYVNEDYDSDLFYSRCVWGGGWSEPEVICLDSGPGVVNDREIATGVNGDAWVAWGRTLPTPHLGKVMLTSYRQGNGWAEPDTVPEGDSGDGIAVGSFGEVWVVTDREGDIWAYQRGDGEWLPAERVSARDSTASGANAPDGGPSIALQSDGTPRVVWSGSAWGGGDFDHEIYTAAKVSGCWLPEEQISVADAFDDGYADFCVSESGEAWAVWQGWDGTDYEILYSRSSSVGGTAYASTQPASAMVSLYPNPGRESVWFRLRDEAGAIEKIIIYDSGGRQVDHLSTTGLAASASYGSGVIKWDCTDLSGDRVPQGCYVFHAQAGGSYYEGRVVILE